MVTGAAGREETTVLADGAIADAITCEWREKRCEELWSQH